MQQFEVMIIKTCFVLASFGYEIPMADEARAVQSSYSQLGAKRQDGFLLSLSFFFFFANAFCFLISNARKSRNKM